MPRVPLRQPQTTRIPQTITPKQGKTKHLYAMTDIQYMRVHRMSNFLLNRPVAVRVRGKAICASSGGRIKADGMGQTSWNMTSQSWIKSKRTKGALTSADLINVPRPSGARMVPVSHWRHVTLLERHSSGITRRPVSDYVTTYDQHIQKYTMGLFFRYFAVIAGISVGMGSPIGTTLHCNVVSHWLSSCPQWSLHCTKLLIYGTR